MKEKSLFIHIDIYIYFFNLVSPPLALPYIQLVELRKIEKKRIVYNTTIVF